MGSSVKEQITKAALQDPFLTVDELARQVGTTAPYVRTVLSEADLSLNKLRREYAKKLEYRLGLQPETAEFEVHQKLQVVKTSGNVWVDFPWWHGLELFQVGAMDKKQGCLAYTQLITTHPLTIGQDYKTLRDLLPLGQGELEVKEQRVEIVLGPHELLHALDLPEKSQVLRLSTFLHNLGEVVAVEVLWLPLTGLVLEFSPENGELKVGLTG